MLQSVLGEWHEFFTIVFGTFIVEQIAWLCFNVPYLLFDDYVVNSTDGQDKVHASEVRWGMFTKLAKEHTLQLFFLTIFYPFLRFCGFSSTIPYPSWKSFAGQFLFINLVEDTGFYWVHRWMHTPWAFKRFHYMHHKYQAPYSLAGEIAHPVEFIFNFVLPIMAGPVLIGLYQGLHITTLWAWLVFRVLRATDAHSGFDLPFHPLRLIKSVYGGAAYHDYHHMVKGQSCNFGGYKLWDWIMSTHSGRAYKTDKSS